MMRVWKLIGTMVALFSLALPAAAFAFPFGGQAYQVVPCYNQAIYAALGPPRGGPYIWTPATKTYQFGPPTHAGQWLLGLAGAPYYCIVSIEPVIVWPGTFITMMGSSGTSPAAISSFFSNNGANLPAAPPPPPAYQPPATSPPPTPASPAPSGHVLISEAYIAVDAAHGTSPLNQWIEIYNGTSAAVTLSGWVIQHGATSTTIPTTSLASGQFLVLVADSTTVARWPIPSSAKVASLGGPIGGGFSSASDAIILKNSAGAIVDAVSWGANASAFSPPASAPPLGYSLARTSPSQDTNTASDWTRLSLPTPGR